MRTRRLSSRLVVAAVLCGMCAGCTSDSRDSTPPPTKTTTSPSTAAVVTLTRTNAHFVVAIERLGDGIRPSQRASLRTAIGAPISAWFDEGFLSPDYPTADFPHAFDSWTVGAAKQAGHDSGITTNATLGPHLVAVVADRQHASVFVFAHRGVTGGAAARVRLVLTAQNEDGSLLHYAVWGSVYLTRDKGRWSIFGYDLQRTQEAS